MMFKLLSARRTYTRCAGFLLLGVAAISVAAAADRGRDPATPYGRNDAATTEREEITDLTLQDAARLALRLNPEFAAYAKEIGALEGAALQAGLWRNPELDIAEEDIGAPRDRGLQRFTTIRFSQLIELGGKRSARVTAASLARDVAIQDYEAKRWDLLAHVANVFTDVLAGQERARLAGETLQLAQTVVSTAGKRVQAGKAPPIEETKARLASSTARIEHEQAQRDLAASRKTLALIWGNPSPRFRRALGDLASPVTLPAFEALAERALQNPLALRSIKSVEQRQALMDLERARRIPDITVSAGLRRYSQFGDHTGVIGVSIPLPLFDRNQGNLREASQRLDKAVDERAATGLRLQAELAQTHESLMAAQNEIGVLREEVLPDATSAFNVAKRGYELGRFGFLEVLDAQRTLFQNQTLYVRALVHYQKLVNALERLIAAPLDSRMNGPSLPGGKK